MTEIWKPVPGYEGRYEVSDQGRARSLDRIVYANYGPTGAYVGRKRKGRLLSGKPTVDGYLIIKLLYPERGKSHCRTLHRVVAEVFLGPKPEGLVVRHLNGIKTDCRVENLAYGTSSENARDSIRHGVNPHSKKTHCKFGHPLSGDNAYIWTKGHKVWRQCRICKSAADRRAKARRRAAKQVAA